MERHPGGADAALRLLELAKLRPCRIIDLGAGAGDTVRALRGLGYDAVGVDLNPGADVIQGDFLAPEFEANSFDAAISECAFFVSGDAARALRCAAELLRPGGSLLMSDICPGGERWLRDNASAAGFEVRAVEDDTASWKEYYIAALWRGDAELPPGDVKNCRYLSAVLVKPKRDN